MVATARLQGDDGVREAVALPRQASALTSSCRLQEETAGTARFIPGCMIANLSYADRLSGDEGTPGSVQHAHKQCAIRASK